MMSQNKIDVSITSWRQGAIWSRPAASSFENAAEGGSSLINAPPATDPAALFLQTAPPTAIPAALRFLAPGWRTFVPLDRGADPG